MTTIKADAYQQLRYRIVAAMTRLQTGQGRPRIPASDTDPDVVLADCLAELDALRAREVELTDAIDSLLSLITGETGENCDVQRAIEALSETRAQFEARILKRDAKLREALKAQPCASDPAWENPCRARTSDPTKMCRRCAALAEGEDTREAQ